jgi:hypothetical protein
MLRPPFLPPPRPAPPRLLAPSPLALPPFLPPSLPLARFFPACPSPGLPPTSAAQSMNSGRLAYMSLSRIMPYLPYSSCRIAPYGRVRDKTAHRHQHNAEVSSGKVSAATIAAHCQKHPAEGRILPFGEEMQSSTLLGAT